MGRPKKKGLDYFPFDVDFFEDEKIVAIAGEFGIKGELAAVKLLCAVYRNGYFIEWSEMLRMKILRQLPGVSAELFDQILNRLVRWGFFDASLFDSVKVLTSVGIQRRYFEITKRCSKEDVDYPYLLVNVAKKGVNVAKTRVNVTESAQIKGNEIKKKISPEGDMEKPHSLPDSTAVLQAYFAPERTMHIESFCMTNRIKPEQMRRLASEVITEWELNRTSHNSLEDAFSHLTNMIKIKVNKIYETNKTDRLSERRGTDPAPKSRKGFKLSF